MFAHFNWVALLVATVIGFIIGAVWYSPLLFGKRWQRELGFTDEYLKQANMGAIIGRGILFTVLMVLGTALLLAPYENPDWHLGLHTGLVAGFLIAAMAVANNYNYQRRSFTLWLIDAGYTTVLIVTAALLLTAW